MITVLTGGTGGAKFLQGLARVAPPETITAVVNTGDDLVWWRLRVSPDLDSITYALAGLLSRERGWGVEGDTFECLEAMRRLGQPAWFQLGDRDIATHLFRSQLLAAGKTLSEATAEIACRFGITSRVLPMTNSRVETRIRVAEGELSFQEYFVRERFAATVTNVRFAGAEDAMPSPGVVEAIEECEVVLVAPSNPVTSIGPILAVPGIRAALRRTAALVGAVSPIVGGDAVSGPAGRLMRTRGFPVSAEGVARLYGDFLDVLVADPSDAAEAESVGRWGIRFEAVPIVMQSREDQDRVAQAALGITRHVLKATKRRTTLLSATASP